jgi:hypothetical protein
MAPKTKSAETVENPFLPPPIDLEHVPLADKDYRVAEPKCEFDFFELHFWLKDIFLDQSDEIGLWESNLPLYMFPQTYHFPEFSLKCQAHYLPSQRAIVSSSGETLFTITPESINQMLQIPRIDSASPFSIEILNDLYQKLSFPQRAQILKSSYQKMHSCLRKTLPIHLPFSQSGQPNHFHPLLPVRIFF